MILIVFVSCAGGFLSQDFWWELDLLCLRWDCLREPIWYSEVWEEKVWEDKLCV